MFFDNTVTADRYIANILQPFVEQLTADEIEYAWFQQDGAPAHTANISLDFLEQFFADRIISKRVPTHEWPARSPDLTPLDFWLWGDLKGKVYENKPTTIDELKENIKWEILQIPQETISNVFDNMMKRIDHCRAAGGGQFQHLL